MSPAPNPQLLSLEATLAAAQRIVAQPARQVQRVAADEVLSLAVMAVQLHAVAEAAAAVCRLGPGAPLPVAAFAEGALAGLLLRAGILQPDDIKGPLHGQS